jgi:predicted O-linked N-acetylglucosamine transferase (SPINDLY family)
MSLRQAVALHQSGLLDQAENLYQSILKERPHDPQVLNFWGTLKTQKNELSSAIDLIQKAIAIKPDYAQGHCNLGVAFDAADRLREAQSSFEAAVMHKPDYPLAWFNLGNVNHKLKNYASAIDCFEKAVQLKPDYAEAFMNCGLAQAELGLVSQADANYDAAINIIPNYAEAFNNKGALYMKDKRHQEALLCFEQALLHNQDEVVHFNLGTLYDELQLFKEASHHFQRVLALNPSYDEDCVGPLTYIQMKMCDWKNFQAHIDHIKYRVLEIGKPSGLLQLLTMSDDPRFLYQAGKVYCQSNYPSKNRNFQFQKVKNNSRLVVGYFSSDFHNHPLTHLISEVFELHDRSQFEIHAFCLSRNPQDRFTQRIRDNADYFWECGALSDSALLNLARQQNLDIALDLNGATGGNRMEIFADRVAPVQINYLGFPGTIGSDFHDYIIADEFLIPPEQQAHYSEKVIYLPCFQANDRKRRVSDIVPSRAKFNLPDNAFVFCCLNSTYKILPTQFAGWMRILLKVPESVLWILTDSTDVETNLQEQAQALGVSPHRLIFSKKMAHSDYLASYVCADLFLDTYPFNAGTTANDALWMGLPLVTLSGNTFASRMAGSLLHAVGLPELITSNLDDYETMAVELANDPNRLDKLRQKLKANRSSCVLFDSPLFVSKLEEQYVDIYKSIELNGERSRT